MCLLVTRVPTSVNAEGLQLVSQVLLMQPIQNPIGCEQLLVTHSAIIQALKVDSIFFRHQEMDPTDGY